MAVPNCPECGSWNWHRSDEGAVRTEFQAGINGWVETYRSETTDDMNVSCGGCGFSSLAEDLWSELVNMDYE